MSNFKIELRERFNPSCKYTLQPFKVVKPFETMMVGTQNYLSAEKTMVKMLKRSDDCQEFSAGRAVIVLCIIQNMRKERKQWGVPGHRLLERSLPRPQRHLRQCAKMHGRSGWGNASVEAAISAAFSF